MFLPPVIIVPICFIVLFIAKLINGEVSSTFARVGESVLIASFVLITPLFFKIVSTESLKKVIAFHQTYNESNINRNPVKFFIKYQNQLLNTINIIVFIGSLIMFYGAFWGN